MKAPFPWFGGKSRVADVVWAALGDVDNYVEPFAGSLGVLLERPHSPQTETVNDLDHWIVNFWRALQHDPAGVAHYANNPVNEADLTARHIWLVNTGAERVAHLLGDPDYYDAKVAGWWVWGICCWIGGSWCSGDGPWSAEENGALVNLRTTDAGVGVNRQRVDLGDAGRGVNRKRVDLGDAGRGVNRKRVHLGNAGRGVATGEAEIAAYLSELAERLRYVRVCCGDWARVVTRGALDKGATVGVFLDPPYDVELRNSVLYNTDVEHGHVSADVRRWCVENGDNPRYRIVLAGYADEHELPGWRQHRYSGAQSYQTANSATAAGGNSYNRTQETLWLSPHCLTGQEPEQLTLEVL